MSPRARPDLPEEAYAVALAAAPSIGPATLRDLLASGRALGGLAAHPRPSRARPATMLPGSGGGMPTSASRPAWRGHPAYPPRLAEDPQAPALLFCLGEPAVLDEAPTVALVGTRAPTRYGIGVAAQLAADLSAAGVSVVSGLALGIDGAAHEGACGAGAPPIGVVAGGLDDPYPRRHARLWERVAAHGAIVSESPAGVRTERWRFPVRNRLLAAMSDVVVVVESRHHGGSRHTVDAAVARGIPVGAVPGSIRSPTSEGTNALVAEGAFPVCSAGDILVALSLAGASVPAGVPTPGPAARTGHAPRSPPRARIAGSTRRSPRTPRPSTSWPGRSGLDLGALCGALERLAQAGLARDVGGWWERA